MSDLQSKKERRKSQRISLNLIIKYKKAGCRRFQKAIACENVSGTGMRVLFPRSLERKEKIDILLCPQDTSKSIGATCRVVWCKQDGESKFKAGLEFVTIEQKQQFIELLCDNLINMSLKD